jgi:SAM-dependent methyltransferase
MFSDDLEYNDSWQSSEYEHRRRTSEEFNRWWIKSNNLINASTEDRTSSSSQKVASGQYGNFQVVWLKNIDRLMDLLPANMQPSHYSFLDVGCGSAVSTLYFLQFYDFKNYQGFDFREELISSAKENLKRYKKLHECPKVPNFYVQDALDVNLDPSTRHFIYMYNPFDYSVARAFFLQNIIVLKRQKCILALSNDVWVKSLLEDFSGVRVIRNATHNLSVCFFE